MTVASAWLLGVDIGGTFTDVVLTAAGGPTLHTAKVRTTPADPVEGVIAGSARVLADAGIEGGAISRVVHATTLATNLVLEGTGARVAFATTEGFRDLIRIPRGSGATAERAESLVSYVQPRSLVPPEMTVEAPERMAADGSVLRVFTPAAAARVAARLHRLRPEAVAVCFLHSYANPAHERLLAEAWTARAPDIPISISSDISPAMREYGRAVTTVVSAYVGPAVSAYLGRLGDAFRGLGVTCPVHIMESSGGVIAIDQARQRAVRTIESGPAAGVMSTQALAEPLAADALLSFDMGGTTAKCGVVRTGAAERRYELFVGGVASWAGRRAGGFPIRTPVVDLAEVGSGGGSIAWLDPVGGLRVGPRSAGADPGPACYGRGGIRPTVTDANLVLGYLGSETFAGGTMELSVERAEEALTREIADPLGIGPLDAAAAVHALVTADMAAAVRMVTVERGLDPRDFVLVSFGGCGPVHVAGIAAAFGIARVVVPAHAGVRSALGMLSAALATDEVQGHLHPLEGGDPRSVAAVYAELERRARRDLDLPATGAHPGGARGRTGNGAGVGASGAGGHTGGGAGGGAGAGRPTEDGRTEPRLSRSADVRFRGQAHQLVVPVPDGPLDDAALAAIVEAFHRVYMATYGVVPAGPAECVNLRLRAVLAVPTWVPAAGGRTPRARRPRPHATREAWFEATGAATPTAVHRWGSLRPGDRVDGAAVVEGDDATVVVPPGWTAALDAGRNIVLQPLRSD